jgi:hypothetical protein
MCPQFRNVLTKVYRLFVIASGGCIIVGRLGFLRSGYQQSECRVLTLLAQSMLGDGQQKQEKEFETDVQEEITNRISLRTEQFAQEMHL